MATSDTLSTAHELPEPADLSHHISRVSRRRIPSSVKAFYKYFMIPGIGNLAGGLPNASYFPYDTLEASVANPNRFKPTPNDPVDPPVNLLLQKLNVSSEAKAGRVVVPHQSSEKDALRRIDLTTALQYGTAQGYPALYYFIRQFTKENLHPNVPYAGGPEIILTCGSTDGFSKTLQAFANVWDEERDWIREREGVLCEEFAYSNAIDAVRPMGLNVVPVGMDDEGMRADGPDGLADVLEKWDFNKGKRPHLMYTVTMGQNPTSGLLSVQRRKAIYALAHKYDILIVEDDPYWYLQFPSGNVLSQRHRGKAVSENFPTTDAKHNYNTAAGGKSSGFPFLDSLVPSYLSVDVDGRVIRLDTFSKTVAPGCRLGWITAQPKFIDQIFRITETSTQQPSGFVQSLIAELIMGPQGSDRSKQPDPNMSAGWKVDGWVRWLEGLRGNYERRMQLMSSILEDGKFLIQDARRGSPFNESDEDEFQVVVKTQMYDFVYPLAGMFLWMHVHYDTHPLHGRVPPPRLARAMWVFLTTAPYLQLVGPGTMFCTTEDLKDKKGWQYFRLCFAAVDDDVVESHSKSVAEAFAAFWQIKSVKEIDEILQDDDAGEKAGIEEAMQANAAAWVVNPIMC